MQEKRINVGSDPSSRYFLRRDVQCAPTVVLKPADPKLVALNQEIIWKHNRTARQLRMFRPQYTRI